MPILKLTDQPEELRVSVLSCLRLMFESKPSSMQLSSAASSMQIHFLAYLVSCLLHIAQTDKCRQAAQLAVDTLRLVIRFVHSPDLLRQFFPGVSVGMWKCINAPHQGSKVVVSAVECLVEAMQLCISDHVTGKQVDQSLFSIEGLRALQTSAGTDQTEALSTEDAWLKETAVNLDIVLSRLVTHHVGHRSWRVRSALVDLCAVVVLECRQTLADSFFRCFEELLVLRVDAIKEVASRADVATKSLQTKLSTPEWLRMVPHLADRFQMHLSTLVLKCETEHESSNAHLMRIMIGYLDFLGRRMESFLDSSMDSIFKSLCRVVEFESLDIDLILHQKHEPTSHEATESTKPLIVAQFQKRLQHFHGEESAKIVFQLLASIGSCTTPALFVDCAFDLLRSENYEDRRAEIVLVLSEFLRAYTAQEQSADALKPPQLMQEAANATGCVDVHLVGRILDDLLLLDEWNEHDDNSTSKRNRANKKASIIQRAMMVECIGICVEILRQEFDIFMLHVLYPLMEKLGSQHVEVERAALTTLEKIYYFGGHGSMETLFEANMDYFVDALCSRLEHLQMYPLTPHVVEGLLRHAQIASLPLMDEVTNSLLRSIDLYQDSPYISSLLRALKLLVLNIAKDKSAHLAEPTQDQKIAISAEESTSSILKQFIDEICVLTNEEFETEDGPNQDASDDSSEPLDEEAQLKRSVKGAMPVEYDEQGLGAEDNEYEKDEVDAPSSPYQSLVIDMMDRCGHFLSESDPIACCLVLSIIDEGVRVLQDARKVLLPLIHRLWPSLMHRLTVKNRPILAASIQLVTTLAECAGDFIGDRFVENVWPSIRSQLQSIDFYESSAAPVTRSMLLLAVTKDSETEPGDVSVVTEHHGRKTLEIRLVLAILECLCTVAKHSDTVASLVPEISKICSKFLSARAPLEIVHSTQKLFEALAVLNGDEVFSTLAPLVSWIPLAPPSSRFQSYSLDSIKGYYRSQLGAGETSHLYRENASVVMKRVLRQ